jgi:hypothetical protein
MTSRKILAEIKEQMARSDARYRELVIEGRARHEELTREMADRYEAQLQITREFLRRNDIAFKEYGEVLGELVQEVRAMREGMFQLIDELRGGGPAPA